MKLKELYYTLNSYMDDIYNRYKDSEDISVVITLSEPLVGCRTYAEVDDINLGFDWEENQLRIEPKTKLVRLGNSLNDIKEPYIRVDKTTNRKYYFCSSCGGNINRKDYYCKYCGQKLREKY